MANLKTARLALKQVCEGIPDFPVFHYVTDSAPPPCAWIEPGDIDYLQTMGSTDSAYDLFMTIITGRVNEGAAQDDLDELVSPDNQPRSVPYIVAQNKTLGGAVDYCVPVAMESYGTVTMGGVDYLGAQIRFEVAL